MKQPRIYQTSYGPQTAIHKSNCVVCHSPLYVWESGDDAGCSGDPRGSIKERNNYYPLIACEYGMEGPDVPMCFRCGNEQDRYRLAVKKAKSRWKEKVKGMKVINSKCGCVLTVDGLTILFCRLHKAAPEMLQALKGLLEYCVMMPKHWGDEADVAEAVARAVIAKAEGGKS